MAVAYNTRVVTDGLVLCLDAGNTKSYNAGISTTAWNDLSGGGNTGTLTNGPTYSSANGGSIVFDGVNDYAALNASSSFNFSTGDFAVESWFYLTGNSGLNGDGNRDACIFNCGSVTNINTIVFTLIISGNSTTTGTGVVFYKNTGGTVTLSRTVSISQNAWHHVVVSRIGTSLNFYLDNSQLSSPTTDSNSWGNSTTTARIGYLTNGTYTDPFPGYIPIVRMYNGKGLTAAEVSQNFNALRGRYRI